MSKNKSKIRQSKGTSPESIALKPGPKFRHGGYTYFRTGKMPTQKRYIEKYLTWVREIYIEDIAGTEDKLTAGQTVLLNKLILLEGLCRCIEVTAAKIADQSSTLPVLPHDYSTYVNLILKICSQLGIERRDPIDDTPDIHEYIEKTYGKKKK